MNHVFVYTPICSIHPMKRATVMDKSDIISTTVDRIEQSIKNKDGKHGDIISGFMSGNPDSTQISALVAALAKKNLARAEEFDDVSLQSSNFMHTITSKLRYIEDVATHSSSDVSELEQELKTLELEISK